jgi:hypothetical protein
MSLSPMVLLTNVANVNKPLCCKAMPVLYPNQALPLCYTTISTSLGARFGPRHIRAESPMVRKRNHGTGAEPFRSLKVGDVGDVDVCMYDIRQVSVTQNLFSSLQNMPQSMELYSQRLIFWHHAFVPYVTIPNVTIPNVTIPIVRNNPERPFSPPLS